MKFERKYEVEKTYCKNHLLLNACLFCSWSFWDNNRSFLTDTLIETMEHRSRIQHKIYDDSEMDGDGCIGS